MSLSNVHPRSAEARVGAVLGKYRVTRLLGVGGMASVFAATHRNGHRVAIKWMLEHLAGDPDLRVLFSREAYGANKVGHEGAVPVLDDDVDEDGCPFLVMPLLEGETLRARWERCDRVLPVADACVLMADVLEVLAAAHANGIVHRDIKPENLFLVASGHVRVLDFGIARHLDGSAGGTLTVRVIGTPAFIAPEQALGDRRTIGPQSDGWAVGATLFSLLSGEFVHLANSAQEQLAAAATRRARSLAEAAPELPVPLVRFIDKALAFAPQDRWPSASAMRAALVAALEEATGEPYESISARVRTALAADVSAQIARARADAPLFDAASPTERELPDAIPSSSAAPKARDGSTLMAGVAPNGVGNRPPVNVLFANQEPRRRIRARPLAGLAALALIGGGAISFPNAWLPRGCSSDPSSPPDLQATMLPVPAGQGPSDGSALAHLELQNGIQSWRDASDVAANRGFSNAIELDPSMAAAHLYLAMLPTWTNDETRAHHRAALEQRSRLDPRDLGLLDAYAPAMATPPDLAATEGRLLALREKFPRDWLVLFALSETQIKRGEYAKAIEVLDVLVRNEPGLALAWRQKAIADGLLDDQKSARDALNQCLQIAPYAETCLSSFMRLEANEGRCDDAERYARSLMAAPSPSEKWAGYLAASIYGRGGPAQSVHDVLERAWPLAPPSRREIVREKNDVHWSVLTGDFESAERALLRWNDAVSKERYEDDHAEAGRAQWYLALELGDAAEAAHLASEYLAKRDAWLASTYFDLEIEPLRVQYLAGGLSREDFGARRRKWLDRQAAREQFANALNAQWVLGYARATLTRQDAVEALRVLPEYLPMTDAMSRDLDADTGIGRTYQLAGDDEKAVQYLRRAARSCRAVQYPFESTWAHLHLGTALERLGDPGGACTEYRVVLARWGKEPRSVSAKAARARLGALGCAEISTSK